MYNCKLDSVRAARRWEIQFVLLQGHTRSVFSPVSRCYLCQQIVCECVYTTGPSDKPLGNSTTDAMCLESIYLDSSVSHCIFSCAPNSKRLLSYLLQIKKPIVWCVIEITSGTHSVFLSVCVFGGGSVCVSNSLCSLQSLTH